MSVSQDEPNPYLQITAPQWVLGGILLVVYLVLVGILNLGSESPNVHLVYISLLVKSALLFAPFLVARIKGWGWFHPLVFTSLWLFVRQVLPKSSLFVDGLAQHEALLGYTEASLNVVVAASLGLQAFALLITYLGYATAPKFKVPSFSFGTSNRPLLKTLLVGAVAGFAFYRTVAAVGGIGELILLRGAGVAGRTEAFGGGHWTLLIEQLTNACLVWYAVDKEAAKRISFWGLFVSSLALIFGSTGSRSGVIVPVLILILIWSVRNRRIPFKRIAIAGVGGLFLLGVLGEFRTNRSLAEQSISESISTISTSLIGGLSEGIGTLTEYSGSSEGMYPILAKVPHEERLLLGKSYVSLLTLPIPRAIWLNKPEAAGTLAGGTFFGNPNRGVPPGSVGEAYWNFHILGVIVIFLAWGWLLHWIGRLYVRNSENGAVALFYVVTLLIAKPHSPTLYEWIMTIVPLIVLAYFFLRKNKEK